jgi:hypothetical protein
MYIANQNFLHSSKMIRRGDKVNNPTERMKNLGLVREIKVIEPETKEIQPEIKATTKRRKRKQNADNETELSS